MKNRILIILIVAISLVSIYALIYKESTINNEEKKVDMLNINIPYSIRQSLSIGIRPSGIEKKYGKADIIRDIGNKFYEIRNIDDGSKLFVIYNSETNAVIDIWQLKKLLNQDDLQMIVKGKSNYNDILKLDPYSTIIKTSEFEAISELRLKNNKSVLINYSRKSEEWIVKNLTIFDPDPSGFTNTISPEDI